jgi:hypothetical protein
MHCENFNSVISHNKEKSLIDKQPDSSTFKNPSK